MNPIERDGQPPVRFYANRVGDRLVAELLGMCKGIVADNTVNDAEGQALRDWLAAHPLVVQGFPGRELSERLTAIYSHGHASDEELADLCTLAESITGLGVDHATRLPLDEPEPTIFFESHEFSLTGHFLRGNRKHCEQAILDRAGRVANFPRAATNYLVIGTVGSSAWAQSSWGNKILRAMDMKVNGYEIKIVSERAWAEALALDD